MARLNPYLNFHGNTEEVFNFYKSVFGGEFSTVMRFKDIPAEMQGPGANPEDIMHISLPISRETVLMGSDWSDFMGKMNPGNNFAISVQTDSEEEAQRIFDKLSDGGNVGMPMSKTFWGAYFGMCHDKYGTSWMVDYSKDEVEAAAEKAELEKSPL